MNATQTTNSTRKEETMREILKRYRQLVTLARMEILDFNITGNERYVRKAEAILDELAAEIQERLEEQPPFETD